MSSAAYSWFQPSQHVFRVGRVFATLLRLHCLKVGAAGVHVGFGSQVDVNDCVYLLFKVGYVLFSLFLFVAFS